MDLAIPQTRLDILRAFVVKESFKKFAALIGDAFNVVNSNKLPLGRLFPKELADKERVVVSNKFAATGTSENVCNPF
jgi:hypothetical protein